MSSKSIPTEPLKSTNDLTIDLQSADIRTLETLLRRMKNKLCTSITKITKFQQRICNEETKVFVYQRRQKEILSILGQKRKTEI